MLKTYIIHHFDRKNQREYKNTWRFTAAYQIIDNELIFAFSRCHDKDDFNKKIGKKLAIEHLNHGQIYKIPFEKAKKRIIFDEYNYNIERSIFNDKLFDKVDNFDYFKRTIINELIIIQIHQILNKERNVGIWTE